MNRNHQILWLLLACSFGAACAFKTTSSSAQRSKSLARSFAKKPLNFAGAAISWCSRTHQLAAVPLEVIDPSYNLALGTLALGTVFIAPGSPLKSTLSTFLGGIPLTLFGLFLTFQTTTLRFTFDDEYFSLVRSNGESTGENLVVGGENVWAYNKFVNYDLFPSRSFPILVYFKETQTPQENWNVGPGEQANSPEAIANGAVPGQVHFFPAIANTEKLISGFQSHGCAKIE
ncbi:hypothetical protein ACHAXA_004325 [Cyclostephanos tholiformis]|uniref:Uncharacterized protein n=1 Tax=Cyclostephanos tholiformis TaxID=382380 RepID=A0ABD3SQB6_9STRA